MSHATPFLCLSRERSQNLGWTLAGGVGLADKFDCIDANCNTASVEPVLNISTARGPFEVIKPAVQFVFVPVMNAIELVGVGDKGIGYQSMNHDGICAAVSSKLDFGISVAGAIRLTEPGSDIAIPASAIIDQSWKAENAAEATDQVEPLVSSDGAPFFSGKNGWPIVGKFWENLHEGFFDVKHLGVTSASNANGDHTVAVVDKFLEDLGADLPSNSGRAMVDDFSSSSHSSDVGQIESGMGWDGAPNLSGFIKLSRSYVGEKLSNNAHHILSGPDTQVKDVEASVVDGDVFAIDSFDGALIGNQVRRSVWDWKPAFGAITAHCIPSLNHDASKPTETGYTGFCRKSQLANSDAMSMAGGALCL